MLTPLNTKEIWFITGSQHLYGPETLAQVAAHSAKIVEAFNASSQIPVKVFLKPTVKTTEEIFETLVAANHTADCIGVVTWMHTFYPA
ncbi:MAG: L-arabinose isomerase, partial [Chryseobacterium taeanense]